MFKIFGAIGRYFRAMCYMMVGRIDDAKAAIQTNKHVVAATFDESINKDTQRALDVQEQIGALAGVRNDLKQDLDNKTKKIEDLNKMRKGAQRAMQRRIDELRRAGKSKEEIEQDAQFVEARADHISMGAEISDLNKDIESLTSRWENKVEQVENFKSKLAKMQRDLKKKKSQKHEVIADIEIAKQEKALNASLTGLTEDQTDKDVAEILRRRDQLVNEAEVSSEMAGVDSAETDEKYRKYAVEGEGESELDGLLDWGDEDSAEKLDDAQIAE